MIVMLCGNVLIIGETHIYTSLAAICTSVTIDFKHQCDDANHNAEYILQRYCIITVTLLSEVYLL